MPAVDASIVFLPRFTTLVGAPSGNYDFPTLPLDVSQYGGAQFQVWRGPMNGGSFTVFFEESLDAQTWVLGPNTPTGFALVSEEQKFFSYGFRLRWFRLRVQLAGFSYPIVSCWAEGLLRGGGSGAWPSPGGIASPVAPPSPTGAGVLQAGMQGPGGRGDGQSIADSPYFNQQERPPLEVKIPATRM